ncbi:MAG: hypothetical protein WC314_01550 [Vulcanimicrobiota bacterium]
MQRRAESPGNNWFEAGVEAGKAEERQRTEQEARRAEILAERLRELGVDPDLLTD